MKKSRLLIILSGVLILVLFIFLISYNQIGYYNGGSPPPTEIDLYLRDYGQKGQVIFPEYEKMKVGETKTVKAYITENISKVINQANEKFTSRNITVTPEMEVLLTEGQDGAFKITPITNKRQYVGKGVTEWDWSVTPLKSGKQTLVLNVYMVILDKSTKYEDATTYKELEQNIDVDVNYVYTIESNWQWIIGTIIALISALKIGDYLYNKYQRKEKK